MQGWGSGLTRDCLSQQPFCMDRQPGWVTFNVLFIHFRWDGGESISPDCPWDVAQNKAAGLWSAPPRGISQLTSNNVNYPLLWSERHWNFNYVNLEPFCSKSADCFYIEGNVVPVWNLGTLNCKAWDVAEKSQLHPGLSDLGMTSFPREKEEDIISDIPFLLASFFGGSDSQLAWPCLLL